MTRSVALRRPPHRRQLPAVYLALLLPALAAAGEVPLPDLTGTEPRVEGRIRSGYARVEAAPASAAAWGEYGMLLDAHRFEQAALVAYEEAHRLDRREFRWAYFRAALLDRSDPRAALAWYERAIDLDPAYAPARVRLGETLETLGELDAADAQFSRAADLDPTNPLGPSGRGRVALARGELAVALDHLERASALAPPSQALAGTLARAYRRAGDPERARRYAEQARRLPRMVHHPDRRRSAVLALAVDSESYLRRSRIYQEVGQLERALTEIETLLRLEPELAEAHLAAAGLYDRRGDPAAAHRSLTRALSLDPDLDGAAPLGASLLFKLGRFREAEAAARAVLAEHPETSSMLLLLSLEAARRGELAEMISRLDRAYTARTGDDGERRLMVQLLSDLAASFGEAGRFDAAAERTEQVLDLLSEGGEPEATLEPHRVRLATYRAGRAD